MKWIAVTVPLVAGCSMLYDFGDFKVCGDPGTDDAPICQPDASDAAVVVDADEADAADTAVPELDAGRDARSDAWLPEGDAGRDATPRLDSGPPPPCTTSEVERWGPSMVACEGPVTQFDAASLCAPGWHLCSMDEYLNRGGVDDPPDRGSYWLDACLDDTGCPRDGVCEDLGEGSYPYSLRTCSGDPVRGGTYTFSPLGLHASDSLGKLVVGCGSCAFWRIMTAAGENTGAMCCR